MECRDSRILHGKRARNSICMSEMAVQLSGGSMCSMVLDSDVATLKGGDGQQHGMFLKELGAAWSHLLES